MSNIGRSKLKVPRVTEKMLLDKALAEGIPREEAIRHIIKARNQPAKSSKIGRNAPCPCGSKKKFKKCHMVFVNRRKQS